jgi:hypothetical protein
MIARWAVDDREQVKAIGLVMILFF